MRKRKRPLPAHIISHKRRSGHSASKRHNKHIPHSTKRRKLSLSLDRLPQTASSALSSTLEAQPGVCGIEIPRGDDHGEDSSDKSSKESSGNPRNPQREEHSKQRYGRDSKSCGLQGNASVLRSQPGTTPPVEAEDIEYEVDEIIKARVRRKKLQYRAKWVGYDDDPEWYDASNFKNSPYKLRDFHLANPTLPGPPRRLGKWLQCWEEDRDADDHPDDSKPERLHTKTPKSKAKIKKRADGGIAKEPPPKVSSFNGHDPTWFDIDDFLMLDSHSERKQMAPATG